MAIKSSSLSILLSSITSNPVVCMTLLWMLHAKRISHYLLLLVVSWESFSTRSSYRSSQKPSDLRDSLPPRCAPLSSKTFYAALTHCCEKSRTAWEGVCSRLPIEGTFPRLRHRCSALFLSVPAVGTVGEQPS